MKPKIIVTRDIPNEVESRLKQYFRVSFNREDKEFSNDILEKAMENADGIVCTVTDNITEKLLTLPNKKVKIIANIGVGVDHIDLQSAKQNNVIITNTPDVLTEATVDIATLLLLSVTRNAFLMETMLRLGEWKGFSLTENLGVGVRGKTLGLVGMGRIGKAIAKRAEAFNCEISYHSRNKKDVKYRFYSDLKELAKEVDTLCIITPGGKETEKLINKDVLNNLGENGVLINVARGSVIDQDELIHCLENNLILAAGLDVYTNEPNIPEKLMKLIKQQQKQLSKFKYSRRTGKYDIVVLGV